MTPPYHYTPENGVNNTVTHMVNAGGYGETAPTITPPVASKQINQIS